MRKLFKYLFLGVGLLYLQAILAVFDKNEQQIDADTIYQE